MKMNARLDPEAAAVPQSDRSVRRALDRLALLPDREQSGQRGAADRRVQHHGARDDDRNHLGRDRSLGRLDPGPERADRNHGAGSAAIPSSSALLIGIAVGTLCGFLNGLMITRLRINAFIVTLGTLGIYRGLALIISNGLPVHRIPPGFSFLGEGNLLGRAVRASGCWCICAVAVHVVLEHTRLGRYAFAIGSNRIASVYAGIPVSFHIDGGLRHRRRADRTCGNDRGVAPDDRPAHRRSGL